MSNRWERGLALKELSFCIVFYLILLSKKYQLLIPTPRLASLLTSFIVSPNFFYKLLFYVCA